ncbi:hypothetical protein ElyMa_000374600 [Elysia marginata]|uniref:Uncharacterized protein n=1 Tax=Elysia marginata TaxID=1093978 RepID=A0AAV4FG83_9GAST|nr:hypothetical protein ElyMa_000374600 [Elysia marginata]
MVISVCSLRSSRHRSAFIVTSTHGKVYACTVAVARIPLPCGDRFHRGNEVVTSLLLFRQRGGKIGRSANVVVRSGRSTPVALWFVFVSYSISELMCRTRFSSGGGGGSGGGEDDDDHDDDLERMESIGSRLD